MKSFQKTIDGQKVSVHQVHTLIIGAGAAALKCADQLYREGISDLLIVADRPHGGTSYNAGSDKQTYYKGAMAGDDGDCVSEMARTLFNGGAMHGDIALAEAAGSVPAFVNLAHIGVRFPYNQYGEYIGYKTDHDPSCRATSTGPYTSRDMVIRLEAEVRRHKIPLWNHMPVISLLTQSAKKKKRIIGAIAMDRRKLAAPLFGITVLLAENVVFGVGGPGGLYEASVYPHKHIGSIGLALEIGAKSQNLTESQFGLASTKFRWNLSGTYQQVIPRYVSTGGSGADEDFLAPFYPSAGLMGGAIFLKGYQWPFDSRKITNYGSSLIDILVYIENRIKKRKTFLDFRANPNGKGKNSFRFQSLPSEAGEYLHKSGASQKTPFARLFHMNPKAIELYRTNGIDLGREPLEMAVCAQHNNGGLSADIWWESTNISRLFPVGEVNGTHGVYRPGGSALNAGQVGAVRAAQRIANVYAQYSLDENSAVQTAGSAIKQIRVLCRTWLKNKDRSNRLVRCELQQRMTDFGGHIRSVDMIGTAVRGALELKAALDGTLSLKGVQELPAAFQTRQLVLAHLVYLAAIENALKIGVGSRGSSLVMARDGQCIHPHLGPEWRFKKYDPSFLKRIQETMFNPESGKIHCRWIDVRPIPKRDLWFESVWADYRSGKIFK